MGEVAVRGVDDGVDRLVEQVAPHDAEEAPRGDFFFGEDFFYSTFAFALSPRMSSSILC